MNSSPDKDFDAKLDQMLAESVCSGAELSGLVISVPPRRPRFNWGLFSALALIIVVFSGVLVLLVQQGGAELSGTGDDFSDWVHTAVTRLFSPEMLVYTGLTVAGIYYFLFTRVVRLLRFA